MLVHDLDAFGEIIHDSVVERLKESCSEEIKSIKENHDKTLKTDELW